MTEPLRLRFVTSADRIEGLPPSPAELAVVGRSNVGKSSLINASANRRDLAKTSKTPGRTRLLNCFAFDDGATLVDCPGYGYASVGHRTRASWQRMVDGYLLGREALTMVLALVDAEVGPTRLDRDLLAWLRAHSLPHTVVATKYDKVKAAGREKRKRELAAGCDLTPSDIVWTSAAKHVGIDRLRDLVQLWLTQG